MAPRSLAVCLLVAFLLPSPAQAAPPSVGAAASDAAGRVLEVIADISRTLRRTRYQHPTVVRPSLGVFLWDCSGMAAWILQRAAPGARRAVQSPRPVARDFYRIIAAAPTDRPRRGWQRVARLEDARPGDVFAWLRPVDWPRRNTGHVGFLMTTPQSVPAVSGAYSFQISDATSFPHQEDTRSWPGEGGFGIGTIMFMTDATGAPTHYGWHGTRAWFTAETQIAVGRVTR